MECHSERCEEAPAEPGAAWDIGFVTAFPTAVSYFAATVKSSIAVPSGRQWLRRALLP
jgi:hypothetical protein